MRYRAQRGAPGTLSHSLCSRGPPCVGWHSGMHENSGQPELAEEIATVVVGFGWGGITSVLLGYEGLQCALGVPYFWHVAGLPSHRAT